MKKIAIVIVLITLFSRMLGFGREVTIAYYYGASNISDAYVLSLIIPTVLFSIVAMGITTGLIPMYLKISKEESEKSSNLFLNNVINVVLIISSLIIMILYVFLEDLIKIFAIGFSNEDIMLTSQLTEITILGLYFTLLVSIFSGFLQIKNNFIIPAFIGVIYNVTIIISIVMSYKYNIFFLSYGSLAASFLQFLFIFIFALRKNFRYSRIVNFKDRHLLSLLKLTIPLMIGQSINQINVLIDKSIASTVVVGGISALNYGDRLNSLILSTVVMTISTIIYPKMSNYVINKDLESFKRIIDDAIQFISLLIIPASLFIIVFSRLIVDIVFGRGEFGLEDIVITSSALTFYSIGMIFIGFREIFSKSFFALEDTKIPLINSAYSVVLNVGLSIYFSKLLGIGGIALATSITAGVANLFLYIGLKKKIGTIFDWKIALFLLKVFVCSIISILLTLFSLYQIQDSLDKYLTFIIISLIYLTTFLFLSLFFKIIDRSILYRSIKREKF